MGLGEMLDLLPAVLAMRNAEVRQLRLPQDGAYANKTISGMAVLAPDLEKVRSELERFLRE